MSETVEFHIVGVMYDHRQRAIAALAIGDPVTLHCEPDNPADAHAVAVITASDHQIGYLAREDAARWGRDIAGAGTVTAQVEKLFGGTADKPSRGVVVRAELASAPADFVMPAPPTAAPSATSRRETTPRSTFDKRSGGFEKFFVGAALGVVVAGAAALLMPSADGPRQGQGWFQIGRIGGARVAVVDVVPFSYDAEDASFADAIAALCASRVVCAIAFEDLHWPSAVNDPLKRGGDDLGLDLLAFYQRDGTAGIDRLRLDCAHYRIADVTRCLPGTAPAPPPAPSRAPSTPKAKPLKGR